MSEDRRQIAPAQPARFGRKSAIVAVLLFVSLEIWIFLFNCTEWDVLLYREYAETFCQRSMVRMYQKHSVEYPPLAVLLMAGTDRVARCLPDCSQLGLFIVEYDLAKTEANFLIAYRLEMLLATGALFWFVLKLLERWQPEEGLRARWERLLTLGGSICLLGYFVFDRLDLMLALLMLAALVLLRGKRHYIWSFAVVALAVSFKVVPAVLMPLWVVGSLPVELFDRRVSWRRLLLAASWRGLVLAGLTLAILLPFYLAVGSRSLVFFTYHKDRGIEHESTYAALQWLMHHLAGMDALTVHQFGSWDVTSSLAPKLTTVAPLLTASLILASNLMLFCTGLHRARVNPDWARSRIHLAGACPEFTTHMILVLMIFLLTNKVFSPQFVLWLTPLVPLIPLQGWPRRFFQVGFIGLCAVTYLICPEMMDEVLGEPISPNSSTYLGPTALGLTLLVVRSLILIALITGLAVHLFRRMRQPAGESRAEASKPHIEFLQRERRSAFAYQCATGPVGTGTTGSGPV